MGFPHRGKLRIPNIHITEVTLIPNGTLSHESLETDFH